MSFFQPSNVLSNVPGSRPYIASSSGDQRFSALASADVPVECHGACRRLRKLEHRLSRAQLSLDALAPRTELDEQQAQSDEDGEREPMGRRQFERILPEGGTNKGFLLRRSADASRPGPRPPYQALRTTAAMGS